MISRRRRALRAAVFGVFGVLGALVAVPGAYAATCVHVGGLDGTATLTIAAGDGTVTISQDDAQGLTYAVGAGRGTALRHGHHGEHR